MPKQKELFELYHESTKNKKGDKINTAEEKYHLIYSQRKKFLSSSLINLPSVSFLGKESSYAEVIKKRRSVREFNNQQLYPAELSQLLFLSYGVTGERLFILNNGEKHNFHLRASPSGGAIYPVKIYIANLNTKAIKKGIYQYLPEKHKLLLIKNGNYREKIKNCYLPIQSSQTAVGTAGVILFLSVFFPIVKKICGSRAYRIALLDAGHLGENIYLSAAALDLGIVGLVSFYDDEIHKILDIDGTNEAVIYSLAVGKKK